MFLLRAIGCWVIMALCYWSANCTHGTAACRLWMLTEQSEQQGVDPRQEWLYTWSTSRLGWSVSRTIQHVFCEKMWKHMFSNGFWSCYVLSFEADFVALVCSHAFLLHPKTHSCSHVSKPCVLPCDGQGGRGLWKCVQRWCVEVDVLMMKYIFLRDSLSFLNVIL